MKELPHWKRSWPDPSEQLPVDVMPASNGEFMPNAPTREQVEMMALAERETERWRRKFGMSRRQFVRTSAAFSIGMWAINKVSGGKAWAGAVSSLLPNGWRRLATRSSSATSAARPAN